MALSDLITRQIATPLEGFDKAVESGFKIAQQQQELSMAQERLKLQQDQIKQEYLTKGLHAFEALSKAKGTGRTVLGKLTFNYLKQAGLDVDENTQQLLLKEESYTQSMLGLVNQIKESGITDSSQIVAILSDAVAKGKVDPEQAKPQMDLIKEKVKAGFAEQKQVGAAQQKLIEKAVSEGAPVFVANALKSGDYDTSSKFFTVRQNIEQSEALLKDSKLIDKKDMDSIRTAVNIAKSLANDQLGLDKALELSNQIKAMAGGFTTVSAQKEEQNKTERFKAAQSAIESRFQQAQKRISDYADRNLIRDAEKENQNFFKDLDSNFAQLPKATSLLKIIESGKKAEIDSRIADIRGFISGTKESLGRISNKDLQLILPRDTRASVVGLLDSLTGNVSAKYSKENVKIIKKQFLEAERIARTIKVWDLQKEIYNQQQSSIPQVRDLYSPGGSIYKKIDAAINKEINISKARGFNLPRFTNEQIQSGEFSPVSPIPTIRMKRSKAKEQASSILKRNNPKSDPTLDQINNQIDLFIKQSSEVGKNLIIEED